MWKNLLLICACSTAQASYALTCKDLTDANAEYVGDYFTDLNVEAPSETLRSQLLRKSVAAFHGDLPPNTTDEEANDIGEDVAFGVVRGQDDKIYNAVYVGFGGGNQATYYYLHDTLTFAGIMSYDGDCTDQGSQVEFPFETSVESPEAHAVTCTLVSGVAPFKTATLSLPLTDDGEVYTQNGTLSVGDQLNVVDGVNFDLPAPSAAIINSALRKNGIVTHSAMLSIHGTKNKIIWEADGSFQLSGSNLKVSGRAYPHIAGGYWSKEAKEYKAVFTCGSSIPSKKIRHQRVIRY